MRAGSGLVVGRRVGMPATVRLLVGTAEVLAERLVGSGHLVGVNPYGSKVDGGQQSEGGLAASLVGAFDPADERSA